MSLSTSDRTEMFAHVSDAKRMLSQRGAQVAPSTIRGLLKSLTKVNEELAIAEDKLVRDQGIMAAQGIDMRDVLREVENIAHDLGSLTDPPEPAMAEILNRLLVISRSLSQEQPMTDPSPEPDVAEIVGEDGESWQHDRLDPACDFFLAVAGQTIHSALHRCRLCREDLFPTTGVHTTEPPEDEAVAREPIVNVRMNSNGEVMDIEYAMGLFDGERLHQVYTDDSMSREEIEQACRTLDVDPNKPDGVTHRLLSRHVSAWEPVDANTEIVED